MSHEALKLQSAGAVVGIRMYRRQWNLVGRTRTALGKHPLDASIIRVLELAWH